MQALNFIDYIIIAIFLLSVFVGFVRGFVREMIALISLVAAFVVACMFSETLAAHFTNSQAVQSAVSGAAAQPVSYAAIGVSFVLIFLGVILIGAILGYLINLIFQNGVLGVGNRFFGAIFGLARGFIFSVVLIFLVQLTSLSNEEWWQQSFLVAKFQPAIVMLADKVSPSLADLKDKIGQQVGDSHS